MTTTLNPLRRPLQKILKMLARQDYSRHDLIKKLALKFSLEESKKAVEEADSRGWLVSETDLAMRTAAALRRKGKSHLYISLYLKRHGLPPTGFDLESEVQLARDLVLRRFNSIKSREEKQKVMRFLKYRGYNHQVIMRVLSESSKD